MNMIEFLKYMMRGEPLEFYSSNPSVLTPTAFGEILRYFMPAIIPGNPDGITNEYLPHALEWEIIHYPAPWSVGN